MSEFRNKSQSQEHLQIEFKNSTGELEAASQQQDQVLRGAGSQKEHLTQELHSPKELLLESPGSLMDCRDRAGRKLCEHGDMACLGTAFCGVLQDLDSQVSHIKGKLVLNQVLIFLPMLCVLAFRKCIWKIPEPPSNLA